MVTSDKTKRTKLITGLLLLTLLSVDVCKVVVVVSSVEVVSSVVVESVVEIVVVVVVVVVDVVVVVEVVVVVGAPGVGSSPYWMMTAPECPWLLRPPAPPP